MKLLNKLSLSVTIALLLTVFTSSVSLAQGENNNIAPLPDLYAHGTVEKIIEDGTTDFSGAKTPYQKVSVRVTSDEEKGRLVQVDHGILFTIQEEDKVHVGQKIILKKSYGTEGENYNIYDNDRTAPILYVLFFFIGVVILFARWKGVTSVIGLAVSIFVITGFIVPRIVAGSSPFVITLIGSLIIASTSLFLAHGFNVRTKVAWYSTLISLAFAIGISWLAVVMTGLTGSSSEEIMYLQSSGLPHIPLQGLLLGGIIIGTLGVLDDVTTAQAATVYEIHRANSSFHFKELYNRGLAVGREHIVSLVNTLVLAYAGTSLPLLLLFSINQDTPWWAIVNSEFFVEEIVRTLAGSIALVLAVPISTALAAFIFTKRQMRRKV